ncbi:endonuclease/exonuclease/phosphatase family protein [Salinifilum ghardaiensis]
MQATAGGRTTTAVLWTGAAALLVWLGAPRLGWDAASRWLVAATALTQYAVLLGAVLLIAALLLRRWPCAAALGVVTALLLAAVLPRAVPDTAAAGDSAPDAAAGEAASGELRVLTVNAFFGRAEAERIVRAVRAGDVDVLAVQELTPRLAGRLDRAGLRSALPHRVWHPAAGAGGSGIAARFPLRERDLAGATTMAHPAARIRMPGGRQVDLVSVHPLYPMGAGTVARWNRDLGALPPPARGRVPLVLAGDFNATLDHSPLRELLGRGYRDAGAATGNGLVPTWPVGRLAPPVTIDHVLTSGPVSASGYRAQRIAGTDHRALLVELSLTGERSGSAPGARSGSGG